MKERNGSTDVETTRQASGQLDPAKQKRGPESSGGTDSIVQWQHRRARLAVAIAGLVVAFLVGVFFVSYGSKLYENWRERRLLN
ncbi:MAG TPA: hypothetical protein VFS68_09740, partial [Candidatus Udaeobacter sp.]|nr:hypothetical protein [Candidatus Udaeobacter sp.]